MLRDVLHYTKEEIDNLSLEEIGIALTYAEIVYVRRDVMFVMSKVFSSSEGNGNNSGTIINVSTEHPDIVKYIKENTVVPKPIKLEVEK